LCSGGKGEDQEINEGIKLWFGVFHRCCFSTLWCR
jgi:hypothetical protein